MYGCCVYVFMYVFIDLVKASVHAPNEPARFARDLLPSWLVLPHVTRPKSSFASSLADSAVEPRAAFPPPTLRTVIDNWGWVVFKFEGGGRGRT